SPSFTLRSTTRPPPREVTWMVRVTSGEMVPFAMICVGRARVIALAVLNNSGRSVSKTSGSSVTGDLLVAAGGSFVQATVPKRAANNSSRGTAAAPFEAARFLTGHGTEGGTLASVPQRRADE